MLHTCPYISSRTSRGSIDRVPRGVGPVGAGIQGLLAGPRGAGLDAGPSSLVDMIEDKDFLSFGSGVR